MKQNFAHVIESETMPCPFCGSKKDLIIMTYGFFNEVRDKDLMNTPTIMIKCKHCDTFMTGRYPDLYHYVDCKQKLLTKWNWRPPRDDP